MFNHDGPWRSSSAGGFLFCWRSPHGFRHAVERRQQDGSTSVEADAADDGAKDAQAVLWWVSIAE